jgi:hypothetical protein
MSCRRRALLAGALLLAAPWPGTTATPTWPTGKEPPALTAVLARALRRADPAAAKTAGVR